MVNIVNRKNNMKVRKALLLLVPAALLVACSTNKELSLLHDDDVYFSPESPKVAAQTTAADKTVTAAAFIEETTPKSLNEPVSSNYYSDYYDAEVAEKVLQDTSAVAKYYNTAYNAPQYYNRDRFRFSVGIGFSNGPMSYGLNYGSAGWGASMGYGYPYGMGYGGGYGWNPYGGYGGYHCPSIYNTGSYVDGYSASNFYSGPRPTVGGNTGTGVNISDPGDFYYRNILDKGNSDRMRTLRTNYTTTRPQSTNVVKQPIYYSSEAARRVSTGSSMSSKGNSGFMNFIRDAGRNISTGTLGSSPTGSRGTNSRTGTSFRPTSFSPSRSFSAPRGGSMRR